MAPYAIAHLKIGLKLYETGYRFGSDERARVYLTNTLESAQEFSQGAFDFAIPALADEAQAVNEVKRAGQFTVAIGNPPYSGHSTNKGEWIANLIDDYKEGFPELRKPAQAKWLSDDYVKFIRFAQSLVERTGTGTVGFISNHSFLDNPTFRGMRQSLQQDFTKIFLLDLHGNSKKKEKAPNGGNDENVFDIQQGVAISLFVRRAIKKEEFCTVTHADLWGKRDTTADAKYDWLTARDVENTGWAALSPRSPLHLFAPRDEALIDEYEVAWPIPKIFSPSGDPAPGIVTTHDQFTISWTRKEAAAKVERFLATTSEEEAREIWRLCSQDQWQYNCAKRELADDSWHGRLETILYRPFDLRVTVFDRNVAVHRRERVMRHMLAGENLGLSTTRSTEIAGGWEHVFASRHLIQHHTVSLKEVNYLFPLYTFPLAALANAVNPRKPNLDAKFTRSFASACGLDFIPDGAGDRTSTFGPEDIFRYIYAVLHSPEYRRRYADFLKSDFPRVPLPGNRAVFSALIFPGARLVSLHLMETEDRGEVAAFHRTPAATRWTRCVTRLRAAVCRGASGII